MISQPCEVPRDNPRLLGELWDYLEGSSKWPVASSLIFAAPKVSGLSVTRMDPDEARLVDGKAHPE